MTASDRLAADGRPGWPTRRPAPLDLLLVEDCPADARLIELHCAEAARAGEVRLTTVATLAEAERLLARHDYACLLVDLGLPDASGAATLERLRGADPDVAMVVLTGDDRDDTAEQALRLGAQDYLVKGRHDAGLLLRRVRFAIEQRRAQTGHPATGAESFASASHDPVTGLPNRLLLEDRGTRALAQAARMGAGVAVLAIGFEAPASADGDQDEPLLQGFAAILQAERRDADTVAALDDGFAVLLAPTDAEADAISAAQRLHQRLLAAGPPGLRLQIGVACFPDDGDTLVDLLERAAQARHRARREGGGVRRHMASAGLRPTISPGSAASSRSAPPRIDWQPWFDVRDGRPVGIEALPARTSPAAAGREAALAVLREALRQFQTFRAAGLGIGALALRCPPALIGQADLPALLAAELAARALEPRDLWLLIGADELADAAPEALGRLRALRDHGCGLVLDAFLDADDSLGVLAAIPIDAVRLGRAAVARLPPDRSASGLQRAIVAVVGAARALSLGLIACGVDDAARRDLLAGLGIRHLQGEALGPILSTADLPAFWSTAARAAQRGAA